MKDESLIEIKEAANKEATNSEVRKDSSKPKETENFSTEVLKTFVSFSKLIIEILVIGWAASVIFGITLYFRNDQKWRDLFNSYDYISQDGEGINNINSGDQGDLNNGSDDAE